MRGIVTCLLTMVTLLALLGPAVPVPTAAAPAVPQEEGVYEEDFAVYTYKDYVENAEWDIWAHALRLSRIDGTVQGSLSAAMSEGGNAVIVWADNRNGNFDIHAQRLDGSGNRLWIADLRVNSDAGTAWQSSPAAAADVNGNVIVAWEDERNGDNDIYVQRLDQSGNRLWASDVRVNSDSGTGGQWWPAVATDSNRNTIVVWIDDRNDNSDIYAQRLDESGNQLWAADVQVNADDGTECLYPTVGVDGNGSAFVVWQDHRSGKRAIYAQRLDSDGNRLWTTDVQVRSADETSGQEWVAVAVDANGNAVIVWENYGDSDVDIYAQRLDSNGSRLWATDVRVNSDPGTVGQWWPAVAVDVSGNAFVAWTDQRNGDDDVYVQQLDGSGNRLWAADVRLHSDIGTASQQWPAVAIGGNGSVIVAWEDMRNGSGDVYAQRLEATGNRMWTADVRVSLESGTAGQGDPVVGMNGVGNAVLVWTDGRNGDDDIYAQKLDASGSKLWTTDVRVNSDSEAVSQYSPSVAMDGGGSTVVVWGDRRNGDFDIYAQKLDGDGNRMWIADVRVNSDSGTAWQGDPSVAADNSGNTVIVWRDTRSGNYDTYAQRLDASGNRLWQSDVQVNSDGGTADQWRPAAAMDESGNAFVVWQDERLDSGDIYAQRLDEIGGKSWPADMRVNSDSGTAYQSSPAIAADGNGTIVVVWRDRRNFTPDIFAQKLDGDGNLLWAADVRVNSNSETAPVFDPTVAADGYGNIVVVWEDYRNDDGDIYAQRLDEGGNRLWTADLRVNSDGSTASQRSPAITVNIGGTAVVIWEDARNGNPDIYAQRINTVGGKTWLADLQVVYPDLFHLPTGTVQSRTVDSIAGDILQATLIVDLQTNGGEVVFYLTNDGGAHWAEVTPGVTHVFTTTGSDLRWRAVLTADPVWPRTPVVNSLRIEYSTQAPYADDYEVDDTCAVARPIAVNGAVQAHSFHQYEDDDWVWFEATAGVKYVLQAIHTGPNADLELELYDACGQPPTQSDDDAFANDARLIFTAPADGVYYVKALNHDPAVYGEDTGYQLSVRTQSPAPVVAIIAGRNEANQLAENIAFMGDQAYRTFRRAGVPRENIRYLSVGADRDADQDGHLDVDGEPTWENVRYAVQDWPRERGVRLGVPFYLYLADHGGTDYYCAQGCAEEKQVTASDLNLWLSNLEATSGLDEIDVILEACYSGSFIDVTAYGPAEVSSPGRVVIASTGSQARAFPSQRGGYFSDAFFTALGDNADLWTAYVAGRTAAQAAWGEQTPWLDDNGDAMADGSDGQVAQGRGLGSFGGGAIPVVDWLEVGGTASGEATVTAQVRDDVAVVAATVEVYPPGFTVPDTGEGETPVLDVDRVVLRDDDGDGVYEGSYTGFGEEGEYRMVAYAWDNDGNVSLPRQAVVPYPTVGEWQVYLPLVMK